MDHDQASYSKLLEKDPRESFHASDTLSLHEEPDIHHGIYTKPSPMSWTKRLLIAVLTALGVAYIIGTLAFMTTVYRHGEFRLRAPDPPYTPASDAIRYVNVKSADGYNEDLQGFPSEAHDKAWLRLVSPSLIRASYEEMQLGKEDPEHSVEVADEQGGYMTSLGVYHELHCLRRLKLYLHKEHYYPKLAHDSDEDTYELHHLNHCLEAIRLSLMCAGNTALYSFQWPTEGKVRKPATKTNSERTCVDWSAIESWATNRTIGMSPKLKHPVHGHKVMEEHKTHDASR